MKHLKFKRNHSTSSFAKMKRSILIISFVIIQTILHSAYSRVAVPTDHVRIEDLTPLLNETKTDLNINSRYDDYLTNRKRIIDEEIGNSFGMDLKLNAREQQANQIIMAAKEAEIQIGLKDPFLFKPSRHLFEVLDTINQTKLFQIIQQMPKGSLLHAHNMVCWNLI